MIEVKKLRHLWSSQKSPLLSPFQQQQQQLCKLTRATFFRRHL